MGGDLSHAVSPEDEAVCVVDETVENGVGDGGIGDDLVPVIHGNLAGDQPMTRPAFPWFESYQAASASL